MTAVNIATTLASRAQTAYTLFSLATGDEELSATQIGFEILAGMGGGKLIKMFSKRFKACKVGNSFVEGTLVSLAEGYSPIEEIKIGDMVLAYDEDTGTVSEQEVIHLIQGSKNYTLTLIEFADGNNLETTSNHPFYVIYEDGNRWKDAGLLSVGDVLLSVNGDYKRITNIEEYSKLTDVYNLTVSNDHTYYVGNNAVLAHNSACRLPLLTLEQFR